MNPFSRARRFGFGEQDGHSGNRSPTGTFFAQGTATLPSPAATGELQLLESEACPSEWRSSTVPRVGFLGAGWIGRHRLEAIAASGAVEIAGIADPSEEAVAAAMKIAPAARSGTDLHDLLGLDLDGIVIATPSALHARQCMTALEQGLAVFCQKPLGRTAAECRSIVAAAQDTDRLLGVDLSYRHTVGMQKIHEQVRGGELGRIFAVKVTFHNAYGPDKAWFYDPALSGGGCVIDLGIHLVDLALWTLDFPRIEKVSSRLFARGVPLRDRTRQVEDFAAARLDLANDATVHLECSWKLHAGRDAQIEVAFYGTEGSAMLRNVNGSFHDFEAVTCRGTKTERLAAPPDAWGGRAGVAWARQLAAGGRFDSGVSSIVQVAATLDAIYES